MIIEYFILLLIGIFTGYNIGYKMGKKRGREITIKSLPLILKEISLENDSFANLNQEKDNINKKFSEF